MRFWNAAIVVLYAACAGRFAYNGVTNFDYWQTSEWRWMSYALLFTGVLQIIGLLFLLADGKASWLVPLIGVCLGLPWAVFCFGLGIVLLSQPGSFSSFHARIGTLTITLALIVVFGPLLIHIAFGWYLLQRRTRDVSPKQKDTASQDISDVVRAHDHCMKNRQEILSSRLCGCFSCLAIFPPDEVVDWTDDDQTAICPKRPVDSVIGSASGFPIEKDFLAKMHKRWFEYR